jgi:HemY protein
MQLRSGQLDEAAQSLERLTRGYPRNPQVLAVRAELLAQREEWDALSALTPSLRKRKALSADGVDALEVTAWVGQVERCDDENLQQCWVKLPKRARSQSDVLAAYIQRLLSAGNTDAAEKQLRLSLDRNWDDALVPLYADIDADAARQIDQAERWLRVHSESNSLLTTLGRLCARRQLWGKARSAYESSLSMEADAATFYHYAELLDQLDEKDEARQAYNQGLALSLGYRSALPAPVDAEDDAGESDQPNSHLRVVEGKG